MEIKLVSSTVADDGHLHLLMVAEGSAHTVVIPPPALANRREIYGLTDDRAVIEAIIREHATRIFHLGPDLGSEGNVALLGGMRADVSIVPGTEADLPASPVAAKAAKQRLAESEGAQWDSISKNARK